MRANAANAPVEFGSFGELLKFLRRRAGLTQRELSIQVGYSDSLISRMEQNERLPDGATLRARFFPALHIEDEPDLAARLLELARAARGAAPAGQPATQLERPRHNLPVQLTSFVGRESQIGEIAGLLRQPNTRLLTLTGPGGIGKTRLALRVAENLLGEFAAGGWLVELASLADPALVPQAAAAALVVREQPSRPVLAALQDYLRAKHLLLVMDNCEHLVGACARLAADLLGVAPHLTILATSREPLGVAGERLYPVPPLGVPAGGQPVSVENLVHLEAVNLFTLRAGAAHLGFALQAANAPAIAQICRRLDGIPLAIELAAARMTTLPVEEIAGRLDDRFRLLASGPRTAVPRHQTLQAVIDWSHGLLTEPERCVFRRLAVFAGGCTVAAAETVCAGEGLEARDVVERLAALVNKSLMTLEIGTSGQTARYRMLETVRQYADEKLSAAGEADAVRARHFDFYLQLSETAEPHFRRREQLEWLARLTTEHDNLRAALAWGLECRALGTVALAANISPFWSLRDNWTEGHDWLSRSLDTTAGQALGPKRARAMYWLVVFSNLLGGGANIEHRLRESLALARATGDGFVIASALTDQAYRASHHEGLLDKAEALAREALAVAEGLQDDWLQGAALVALAAIALNRGSLVEAQAHSEAALALHTLTGERAGRMEALGLLSALARSNGAHFRAAQLMSDYLALAREIGTASHMIRALTGATNVACRVGDFAAARAYIDEALALARQLGSESDTLGSLVWLCLVASIQADCACTQACHTEAALLVKPTTPPAMAAWSYYFRGRAAYYCNELAFSLDLLTQSVTLRRQLNDVTKTAQALNALATTHHALGQFDEARQAVAEAFALTQAAIDQPNRARLLHSLGRLALADGDDAHAAESFRESLQLRVEMSTKRGVAESLEGVGDLAARQGNGERAARLLGAAEALRELIGAPIPPPERAEHEQAVAAARDLLEGEAFARLWADGRALTWEQAAAYALEG
jgi:predicted ATPase/transcriptional regulator with XRE-family HTH domain